MSLQNKQSLLKPKTKVSKYLQLKCFDSSDVFLNPNKICFSCTYS